MLKSSIDYLVLEKPLVVETDAKSDVSGRIRLNALKIEELEHFIQSIPGTLDLRVNNINSIKILKNVLDDFDDGLSKVKLIIRNDSFEHEVILEKSYKLSLFEREKINEIKGIEII